MTFKDRYDSEPTWHGRAMIMEIFHLAMSYNPDENWTVTRTAKYFNCSIGLVSENLRLAQSIHSDNKILNCNSRQDALKYVNGRRYGLNMETSTNGSFEELD